MRLHRLIHEDLRCKAAWCYGDQSWRAMVKVLLTDGTAAMIVYRLMQWSRRYHLAPVEMLLNKVNAVLCNCIIGRGAEFGPGFVLIHSTGVVINGSVHGGRDIRVEHQVTIGAERGASPVLENNIFIGAGAKVIGAVRIRSNSKIGANAVVVDDVPNDCTVVGIPARVIKTLAIKDSIAIDSVHSNIDGPHAAVQSATQATRASNFGGRLE